MHKVIIIGRLGKDPEMRYTQSGNSMSSFSVASSRKYRTADGEQKEETEWFNCTAFGRLGEVANQYLGKGKEVFIEGRLSSSQYERRDGTPGFSLNVAVTELQMVGSRGDGNGGYGGRGDVQESYARPAERQQPQRRQPDPAPAPQAATPPFDPIQDVDDLPF